MSDTGRKQDEHKSSDKKLTALNEEESNVNDVLEDIYQRDATTTTTHHNAWYDLLRFKIALPMSKEDIETLEALLKDKGDLTDEDIRVIKETLASSMNVEKIMTEGKEASTGDTSGSRKKLQKLLSKANSVIRLDRMEENEFETYHRLYAIGDTYLNFLLDDGGTIPDGIDPDEDKNYDTFADMTPTQQTSLIIASYKAAGAHLKMGFNKRLSSEQRLQRNGDGGWLILSDLQLKAKATPAAQVVASVAHCLRRPTRGTPLAAAYNAFKNAFTKLINENPGWQRNFGTGAEKLIEMLAEQIFKDHALNLHPELAETIADLGAMDLSKVSIAHTYHVLTMASKLRKTAGNTAKMFASITGDDDEDPDESYYGDGRGSESKNNNAWQRVGEKESKRDSRPGGNYYNKRNSRSGDNDNKANNENTSLTRVIERYSAILDDIVDSGDATKYTMKEVHTQASKDAGLYKVYDFRRFVKNGLQSKQWSKKAMNAKWKRASRDSGGGDQGGASKDAMDTLRAEMKSEIAAMTKSSDEKFEQLIKAINGEQ